jgi:hypothetical protein
MLLIYLVLQVLILFLAAGKLDLYVSQALFQLIDLCFSNLD